MTYDTPEPDAFQPRDAVINLFRHYAAKIKAPVRLGTNVTRVSKADDGFEVDTSQGPWHARNVVQASGAFQLPRIPTAATGLTKLILQLHSNGYRNPHQLPDGAVLVVGTGQSGGQITEDLLDARREVQLSVSTCSKLPDDTRGQDLFHWILQVNLHGPEHGINGLQVDQLHSPGARFMCNPLVSGNDGGHSIRVRELGRRGVRLRGHFDGAHDGVLVFSDDLPERFALVERGFAKRMNMLDAYIAAAGIDAPQAEAAPPDNWLPPESGARLDLDAEGITAIIWSTGYRMDFGFLDIPVLDEWNYPRHTRGVTEAQGLYPWGSPGSPRRASATLALVGQDAEYIVGHVAER